MSSGAGDGTKVTTDPATLNDPKNENPGVVTSDSLAAESINEGGSFAANADSRGPMSQPSRSTNTNTTDTSNATRLEPAPDAEARKASEEWSENAQLNAGSALGGKGGTFGTGGTLGGSSGGSASSGGTTSSGSAASGGVTSSAGNVSGSSESAAPQPKGKNITEGGFDSEAPNASFGTDIGGENDPGRAALDRVDVPVSRGAGPRQGEVTNDGQFDGLKDAEA